jgi:hypothetical protein
LESISGLHKRLKMRGSGQEIKTKLYDLLPESKLRSGLLVVQGGVRPAAGGEEQGADGGGGAGEHLHGSSNPEPEPLTCSTSFKRKLLNGINSEQAMLDIEIHYYVRRLDVHLLSTECVCLI